MTSGTAEPARVVSTLVRWFVHCWYSTSTCAPVCLVNMAFVSATACGQPLCAPPMSPPWSVLPAPDSPVLDAFGLLAVVPPLLPHAAAPTSVAASAAATA